MSLARVLQMLISKVYRIVIHFYFKILYFCSVLLLIGNNMKIKNNLLGMMAIASLLVIRNSHPKFQTSVDVVEGCKKELVALKGKMKMSMDQFIRPP